MIELRRVCENNLKGIDLDLPYGKLIVFCGRSGSGKTSLAVDTLYAEGQRRYLETFSADTRRFFEQQKKPDAERIDGIPPAVAVTSKTFPKSSTHTVGSATEIIRYLELLFAKVGKYFCSVCGTEIKTDTPQSVFFELQERFRNDNNPRIQITFPLSAGGFIPAAVDLTRWKELGFLRGIIGNTPFRLDEGLPCPLPQVSSPLLLIVDRLTMAADNARFIDSLETAMDYGQGHCTILVQHQEQTERFNFSRQFSCGNGHNAESKWNIQLAGKNIDELSTETVADLERFFETLEFTEIQRHLGSIPLEQIQRRLRFLNETGLGYLSLNRSVQTLSSGEQRRIGLTPVLSSCLAGLLYVLDEPTLGLHPCDTEKLLNCVQKLRANDNTVIVIEHDETFIAAADYLVEFGPGGGENGGRIIRNGEFGDANVQRTKMICEPLTSSNPLFAADSPLIKITNCRGNNLKNIDVSFPLGGLCTVTGVSGSGKSSLILDTLYPALCRYFCYDNVPEGLPFDQLTVLGDVQDVVMLDTETVGKSSRANPATYLKILDEIRIVFAEQPEAAARNFTASRFSFNTEGGRCEHCKGGGSITVDMQILPAMTIQCPECKGKRYRTEILEILYRGKNVADVLTMTAREAFSFFRGQNKLQRKLKFLLDAGLDYIQLGQPLNTLSGGELQRLKLAAYLAQIKKSQTLIIIDEPAAGLHHDDIVQLLECFRALIQTGHSLIVAEHNVQFIQQSDYVIDLGPGTADEGGQIVVQGTPKELFVAPEFSHRRIFSME